MAFNQPLNISDQDIYTVQPQTQPSGLAYTSPIEFGQIGSTSDGRQFQFGVNSSAGTLAAGLTATAAQPVANHLKRTNATAEAIGSTTVVVPLGATAATQNQYLQGYLAVVAGTGAGQLLRVKSNPAANASASLTVTLRDPLLVALDTTSILSLYPAPMNGVAENTTAPVYPVVGVPVLSVPASNYFWAQIVGWASVGTDSAGGIAQATTVAPSTAVAGAVAAATSSTITQKLGYAPFATTTSQYQPIVLTLPL